MEQPKEKAGGRGQEIQDRRQLKEEAGGRRLEIEGTERPVQR